MAEENKNGQEPTLPLGDLLRAYGRAGVKLVPVHREKKKPMGEGWGEMPGLTPDPEAEKVPRRFSATATTSASRSGRSLAGYARLTSIARRPSGSPRGS